MLCEGGFGHPVRAATGTPDPNDIFAIQIWTAEDGMPQNIVTALLQSSSGYIWASSYNGISQFDGESFRVFDSTHSEGFVNNRITSLFEDAAGNIWIGHDTSDLSWYRGGKFQTVPIHAAWRGGTISGIGADRAGDVWIINIHGEAVRARDSLVLKPPPEMTEDPSVTPQLVADGERRLLMVRNGYVAEITPQGFVKLDFHDPENRPYYSRVAAARQGGLWVLGMGRMRRWTNGRWAEDLGNFPWENFFATTMMETTSGQLLVGTLSGGLYIHDRASGWLNLNRSNGLSQDWVRCIMEDSEHNIWLGTSGGLIVLRPRSVVMRNPPDGFQGRPVRALAQSHDGSVWAATEGAGLYQMSGSGWQNFSAAAGISNPFIWSVIEDSAGRAWVGTWGGGLFRREETNFVRKFDLAERGEPVTALMESPPGTLWIGTAVGLIRCMNDQIERFAPRGGAAAGDVRALEPGPGGGIWFGTQGGGLGQFTDGQFRTFHRTDGLSSEFVLSLHQQEDGSLWIGTLDRGVCLYKNGRFHTLTTDQGLPNNTIGHIEDDGRGNLWFSTQQGLFRAAKSDLLDCVEGRRANVAGVVLGKPEGLATVAGSDGFTPSGFRAADGKLWFPTPRGIAIVNPESVRRNSVPPPVFIEEMLVNGQRAAIRSVAAGRPGENDPDKAVTIEPGKRQVDVLFTGLSYTSPDRVQFKYRLEGLERDWTWGGTRRRVTYPFLPPGHYAFRVIACNSDGLWNERGDAVMLAVQPFFWQTWWFQAAGAAAGVFLVGGVVSLESRRRHRRKLERVERARELERERARIAQDIHDDLGASLTRIGMLSESATEDLDDRDRAAVSLGQIYSTARELTRAMDEIVWAVNPRHDTLESLTNYIARFAHDFLSSAQIRCRLDAPMRVPEAVVRSDIRHNLFLAFKEALNNAVKHSGASEVRVALEFGPDTVALSVADNGVGFNFAEPAAPVSGRLVSGHGLANFRARLEQVGGRMEIQTKKGEGTRVVFIVTIRGMKPALNGER